MKHACKKKWNNCKTVYSINILLYNTKNVPKRVFRVEVEGGTPGMRFERGSHRIVYTAADSTGATVVCQFTFKVSGMNSIVANHLYTILTKSNALNEYNCKVHTIKL